MLFVYSDSPVWRAYIEQNIIPRIEHRAILLNWTQRSDWLSSWSLPALVFKHFGGKREFNPSAFVFRPMWIHRSFRFWKPFKSLKHGDKAPLQKMETDFYSYIS